MLNVKLENLGNIKEANIQLGKLTIFAGANNSGKTYVNYILYALLDKKYSLRSNFYSEYIDEAKENGVCKIDLLEFLDKKYPKLKSNLEKSFVKTSDRFFSAEEDTFSNFKLTIFQNIEKIKEHILNTSISNELGIGKNKVVIEVTKEKGDNTLTLVMQDNTLPNDVYLDFLSDIMFRLLFSELNKSAFLLPAERTGINLFYQELNTYRNSLINNLQKNKINPIDVLKDMMVSKYPQPIADYIEFLNNTSTLKKHKSPLRDLNDKLHHKIVRGKYNIDRDGSISFLPYKKYFQGNNFQTKIDLHLSSSTVKTFFSLEFYLEHIAKEDSYLIIDEPELNLHPDNQRNIARLIAQMVNRGVNVILSTHSDYIVREFNNLIMLNSDFDDKNKLLDKYGYEKEELLNFKYVQAYLIDDGVVSNMDITEEEGI
ncbi:AAA family ATPase, partial [Sulfurimonas sp.]